MNPQKLNEFSELPEAIFKNVAAMNITTPTEVQSLSYFPALEGKDILAQSKTGSGKTMAFLLPVIARLSQQKTPRHPMPKTLILAPTRELAIQIEKVALGLGRSIGIRCLSIVGGDSYTKQRRCLSDGIDIVIGTPGRIADLLRSSSLNLSKLENFILDEVDEMLDIGFIAELTEIQSSIPKTVQTLFFSATLNKKTTAIANKFLKTPTFIKVEETQENKACIEHSYILVKRPKDKIFALISLLLYKKPDQALIFCETKAECAELTEALNQNGLSANFLNSDLNQNSRNQVMTSFKEKRTLFLVATNIAARGIDVKELPLVVNFDPPKNTDSYTHRTGRTGRAGHSGNAWTLVTPSQFEQYNRLIRMIQNKSTQLDLPSEEDFIKTRLEQEVLNIEGLKAPSTVNCDFVDRALDSYNIPKIRELLRNVLLQRIQKLTITNPANLQGEVGSNQGGYSSFDRGSKPRRYDDRGPREGGRDRDNGGRRSFSSQRSGSGSRSGGYAGGTSNSGYAGGASNSGYAGSSSSSSNSSTGGKRVYRQGGRA